MVDNYPELPPQVPEPKLDHSLSLYEPKIEIVDKSQVNKKYTPDGLVYYDQQKNPVFPSRKKEYVRFSLPIEQVSPPRYVLIEGGMKKSGGMGTVCEFWDTKLEKRVMGKNADYDTNSQYLKTIMEARKLARLVHPNIVTIHDIGFEPDGNVYYIMDLIDGNNLDQLIEEDSLSLSQISSIVHQMAQALSFIHQKGYIYSDFKPQNIIIRPDGITKLVDFGVMKKNIRGYIIPSGRTPFYTSPECIYTGKATQATDIYAFAATTLAMLLDSEDYHLFNLIKTDRPLPETIPFKRKFQEKLGHNSKISRELCRIFYKSLSYDPTQRHSSIEEFASEIEAVFQELGSPPSKSDYSLFPKQTTERLDQGKG